MKTKLLILLITICLCFLSACNTAVKPNLGLGTHLQSWIDAPLDSMHLPLAPYDVVFHLTDDNEVSAGEVSVNGSVLSTLPNPDHGNLLVTLIYTWTPSTAGDYVIRVRAQGSDGSWGNYAEAKVTVGEETPTITPTITPTLTPTLTPTATITPAPTGFIFTPQASNSMFQYQADCVPHPKEVTIEVAVSNREKVYSIVLFYRLKSQSGNIRTQWNSVAMNPLENGKFTYSISGMSFPDLSPIRIPNLSAWLMYQFFATDTSGAVIGQSEVYSDVAVESCN